MMSSKMLICVLFLLLNYINVSVTINLNNQAPAAKTLWNEVCSINTMVLNDCNWCKCSKEKRYVCDTRVCSGVDMFGHFNDAIQNMDVGMEGHGVWRSDKTVCEPGVNYRKAGTLCICTEDGAWPSPVCRDLFQILHAVEITHLHSPDANQTCAPHKLHLVGCNVCYCPSKGTIDPEMCTTRKCAEDEIIKTDDSRLPEEIYATCDYGTKYQMGCQSCICLRNNRLLCDNCTEDSTKSICADHKPDEYFTKDCNFCYCDKKETIYCTAKKCLPKSPNVSIPTTDFELVNSPADNINCVPGTKYKQQCNTCHCFITDSIKYFACTIKHCKAGTSPPVDYYEDCVEGTTYEVNNLICECVVEEGVKMEFCYVGDHVKLEERSPLPLDSMHGYCEPLHYYQQDCNKCRCLADGKTVACTSKNCKENFDAVEIIPFLQKETHCPKGHKYKVDCNICYCLDNGNALCSANKC